MSTSRRRPLRRLVAAIALASAFVPLAGAAPASAAGEFVPLIHLNACDRAVKCEDKTGTATVAITALVQARRPDLLTLNEMCSASVDQIARTTGYHAIFTQAGKGSMCRNGRGQYGNAILAAPQRTLTPILRYRYKAQAKGVEKRLLTCADSSGALVCTTHLDYLGRQKQQAREMRGILAGLLATRNPLMFFGADLNLDPAAAASNALPKAMRRFGDGRVMHIFYSKAFGKLGQFVLPGTKTWTDHAGLSLRAPLPSR